MMNNPSQINRRRFIRQAALVSMGFTALSRCTMRTKNESVAESSVKLVSDPEGYLDLPEGFTYRIVSKSGQKMNDGLMVPARPDGMGAFDAGNGKVILVRNHENNPGDADMGPFGKHNDLLDDIDRQLLYDAGNMDKPGMGGTTTLVYNEETQQVELQYLSLGGTIRNCAGGVTPWNSWLTCEEDVSTAHGDLERDHGFVFEVPANTDISMVNPRPILEMGRFNHEAVAVDPESGIVYQTEDRGDGLFYRYIPNTPGKLHEGGKLQVLMIKDHKSFDTRNWKGISMKVSEALDVAWMDIDDVLSPHDDLRYRGFDKGAAQFARGEGIWYGNSEFYFACTNGGPHKYGQVFRYQPSPFEGKEKEKTQPGKLTLFAESTDKSVLHMCDNLTVAPWGDVILCEDNSDLNYIRGINQKGEIYNLACNRSSGSEFAGAVFSPSGKTLFVNLQENGDTIAINGPWAELG